MWSIQIDFIQYLIHNIKTFITQLYVCKSVNFQLSTLEQKQRKIKTRNCAFTNIYRLIVIKEINEFMYKL